MNAAFEKLFDELVPNCGKAESMAGEIVRATARIGYRFNNDGDRIGVGYGRVTCNAAARFLIRYAGAVVGELIESMWGMEDDVRYEDILFNEVIPEVAEYIEKHPALRKEPSVDMLNFREKNEDVDDSLDGEDY